VESTQQDIVIAAKNSGLKVAGSILSIVGGLGLGIVLTRILGAEGFGQYRLGLITAEFLAQIAALGVPEAALLFIPIAARRSDAARITGISRLACVIPVMAGSLIGFGTLTFADEIAQRVFRDPGFAPILRIFSFAIPLSALLNALEAIARAFNRVDISVVGRDICLQAARIIGTVVVLFAGYGVGGAGLAHVMAIGLSILLLIALIRRLLPERGEGIRAEYRIQGIWKQSLPLYLTRFQLFGGQIENLILGFFGMTSGVGIYAAALQMSRVGDLFPQALSSVALPLISGAYDRGGSETVRPLLRAGTRWALTATLPVFLVIVFYAEALLSVFGKEFSAGRDGLILLACLPVLRASSGLSASALSYTRHARVNAANSALYLMGSISFNLILVPSWGVLGAAISAFTAMALLAGVRVLEVIWLLRISPYDRNTMKPIGAAAVAAIVGYAVSWSLEFSSALLAVVVGVGAIGMAHLGTLLALGISDEDRMILDRVRSRMGRRKSN
jgi:O-antigen/teichoic acid export membrane protein